jgi:hypothetical protein
MATQTTAKTLPVMQSDPSSSGRMKVRVFIEGIEVPVIKVTTTFGMNMPSMANIELVPLAVIKFIQPRSQVHVFVRDANTFGNDSFYLCFEGEVMGRSMVKQHNGRGFRITAYDYTNYWDDTKAFIMNPNFIAGRFSETINVGDPTPDQKTKAEAGKTMPTASNTNSLMIDYLTKYKDENGTPEIIKGIMEVASQLALVNEFYRAAYERLRILDRMDMRSSGKLETFLKSLKVYEFLSSYTGQQGGMITLRQMLMGILTLFFHESTTVPFPSFVKKDSTTNKKTIKQFLFLPDMYLVAPPKCNVIFPNQQTGFEFDEDFKAAPTRYGFRNAYPLISGNDSTLATYPIRYYPPSFADYMTKGLNSADTNDINSLLGPSQLIKSADGRTYANIHYGDKSQNSKVNTAYSTVLKESDYVSNEESIKGIFYDSDIMAPAYTSLIRWTETAQADAQGNEAEVQVESPEGRNAFLKEIGGYLFFKKRYGARQVRASILFNPFLVPGFNSMFLDDSDAGQSFIAKVQTVTHSMSNQGFATTLDLGFGRDFDEVDVVSGGSGDPPMPGWFDNQIYGTTDTKKTLYNLETQFLLNKVFKPNSGEHKMRRDFVANPTVFPKRLSEVYQQFFGCDAVTTLGEPPKKKGDVQTALVTNRGVVQYLLYEYGNKKSQIEKDAFVRQYIKRPVVTMEQAFFFLGAEPSKPSAGNQIPAEFASFKAISDPAVTGLPGRFDGGVGNIVYSDKLVLQKRRDVITSYVEQLKTRGKIGRGVRG